MKKDIEGKRCVLDQDHSAVKEFHNLIENLVVKEEKMHGNDLTIIDGKISGVSI